MGGSSSQVVGYRYYANFLMFIGNPIENLLAINFDKRGWHTGRRVSMGSSGELCYLHLPNEYGENEGGVSGVLNIKKGSKHQTADSAYTKYMNSISLPVSAYPYQSYISFSGSELANQFKEMSEEELQYLADEYEDGIVPGKGFYLGNSGYMKEMLLWVKRTQVRNDGREQWYKVRGDGAVVCEIGSRKIFSDSELDVSGIMGEAKTDTYRFVDSDFYSVNETVHDASMDGSIAWNNELGRIWPKMVSKTLGSRFIYGWPAGSVSKVEQTAKIKGNKGCYVRANVIVKQYGEKFNLNFTDGDTVFIVNKTEFSNGDAALTTIFDVVFRFDLGLSIKSTVEGVYYHDLDIITQSKITVSIEPVPRDLNIMIDNYDINPIHKIREILTDDTAMGKPEDDVNNANFIKAADRIYDEGLGISWAIDEKSCIEAIEELCYHIEAGIRVNRQTGLYEMVLFRDDWFEENEIHNITENKIKDLSLEVMSSDDVVNQLNVTYYDRQRIKNSTFSVYENGSILTMGHTNAESVELPYFMNMRNAEIVANWKLKQFSTPAWSGSFTTGWREARKWNRYDLIRLPWSKKWNGTILVRIMKINLGNGTDNTVTIDFEEVIPYSGEMNTTIAIDESMNEGVLPPQPSENAVFEAPYYLTVLRAGQTNAELELSNNPDIGYVVAIAAKPQSNSINALLYTDSGVGEFEQVSRLDYCDILQLDQPIIETTSSFTVTGSLTQTANSNNLILLNGELMGFVNFDDATKVLTVKRGVLDTLPQKHHSGSLFVFDLSDIAFDSTQYAQSEVIEAQVLTTTPSGVQELAATGAPVEIHARAIRPYPPANVKFSGAYFPEIQIVTNDIVLTWSHRNRVQQTGGDTLGWYEGDVIREDGVTYSYELISENVVLDSASGIDANTVTIPSSVLIPNKPHTLKIWSARDGYKSYQNFEHSFFAEAVSLILSAIATSNNASGNTLANASITVNVDTSLSANMRFDGSGISGKAESGSVITIEVDD